MRIYEHKSLLAYNTFGIDVNADYFVEYDSVEDLQAVLKSELVQTNRLFALGGGSNLLFLKDFRGVVLYSSINRIEKVGEDDEHVLLKVGSGVVWDDFVGYCVDNNWGGVENLSLIPGVVGASAVQNIGAYGVEVQDVIVEVHAVNITTAATVIFPLEDCRYGYRESIFKNELKGKFLITSVVFRLQKNPVFKLNYQHLEEEVLKNGEVNLRNIRQTIIAVRESKLPDTKVLGNAGSFFMNPVIPKQHFLHIQTEFPQMPHYYVSETEEKIPAGWLIEQCGWKGKRIGNAGVHDKQALVLINYGGASGAEIVSLAEQIQVSVKQRFGVELKPEVNYIA